MEVAAVGGRATDAGTLRADVAAGKNSCPPESRAASASPCPLEGCECTDGGVRPFRRRHRLGRQDGPAKLVFLIAVPDGAGDEHLQILASSRGR